MGMSRCYSLIKCLVIIFNIIFLCVGSAACGLAAWALWDARGASTDAEAGRAALAGLAALGAWGGALALGALAALVGVARGSGALLAAALALLLLSALAEGGAAWWGAAHGPRLERALRDSLAHAVRAEYGVVPSRTHLLDVVQQGLECCGAEGPRDWRHAAWQGGEGAEELDLSLGAAATHYWVPGSCCARAGPECEAVRRVGPGGVGAGLHGAACAPRVLAALARMARAPLALGAALLVAQALALPLLLALWLHARPPHAHKA